MHFDEHITASLHVDEARFYWDRTVQLYNFSSLKSSTVSALNLT